MVQTLRPYVDSKLRDETQVIRHGKASVRELANFLFVSGDLYADAGKPAVDPEEGIETQLQLQQQRLHEFPTYIRELGVKLSCNINSQVWELRGRADGCFYEGGLLTIEEFKTTRALPDKPNPIDYGQCFLYGAIASSGGITDKHTDLQKAVLSEVTQLRLRLIYVHADTYEERTFEQTWNVDVLKRALAFLLLLLEVRMTRHLERVTARIKWSDKLAFPMPSYRKGQQAIARRVYRALKASEHLLLEAPTGSGKSLAVLYPGVRAMGLEDQIFFLTSRNAGSKAAVRAASQLDGSEGQLRAIELTAKEKICPVEGMPCRPQQCTYAAGYFDRVRPAIDELLSEAVVTSERVAEVAEHHQVCPFELSLDTSVWSDLVIGDYNYVLDPVVRLKRFASHDKLHLLIDEAHQLGSRVQDMLGAELDRNLFRRSTLSAPDAVLKTIKSVNRALLKLVKTHGDGSHVLPESKSVDRAVKKLIDSISESGVDLSDFPDLKEISFACHRWLQTEQWVSGNSFAKIAEISNRTVHLRIVCLDIAPWFNKVTSEHGGCIRFSATLTPLDVYQRIHGQTNGAAERAPSPFAVNQSCIMVVPDVPTYYRSRARSLPKLAALIDEVMSTKPGRYLIALPSYAYLEQLYHTLSDSTQKLKQTSGMDRAAIDALLQDFAQSTPSVLFVVLGGVLGESVDFSGVRMQGVFVVGVGLPPPTLTRDLMAAFFDAEESSGWGQRIAYTQPALSKIQQAAGRLIRDDKDRGVICLIDPRFDSNEVKNFQPDHWHPVVVTASNAAEEARQFWQLQQQLQQLEEQNP